ncbi:hypothetical protein BS17DRAFT_790462 [Gyrodon lividus]|nr:hypothetical protein BS17DRAFT_790462 [Gyrodon lividus]
MSKCSRWSVSKGRPAHAQIIKCAHIFPESTNSSISGNKEGSDNHQYATSVWVVTDRFGYNHLPSELNGANIHRLKNVLTLQFGMHELFDGPGSKAQLCLTPMISAGRTTSQSHQVPRPSCLRRLY